MYEFLTYTFSKIEHKLKSLASFFVSKQKKKKLGESDNILGVYLTLTSNHFLSTVLVIIRPSMPFYNSQ